MLGPGSEKLSDQLDLLIKDGTTTVYTGKLGAMGSLPHDGDTVAAGSQQFGASGSPTATHTYAFTGHAAGGDGQRLPGHFDQRSVRLDRDPVAGSPPGEE